ncbi:NAD(+) hydrolase sarm1 isoform X2 [Calliphora vicina]|uniref:NAD(+) hydrolase sarm1 isoform X2 n=1 Tax=Calliphora vicina TaxID=7373 RepID=UPI00325B50B1
MNSSHLVTPMNSHQHHHHNSHHPHASSSSYTSKMPTTNNNQPQTATIHNYNPNDQHAGLSVSNLVNKSNNSTTNTHTNNSPLTTTTNINNVGAGLSPASASSSSSTPTNTSTTSYKFAPARRLAARQTLRLAIPKQPGDSQQHSQLNSTAPATTGHTLATQFKHSSPSQLPPAPILKRTPINTPNFSSTPTTTSLNSHIPKSASPLESHHLPNVLHHSTNTPICTAATPSSGGSNKFLRVRNPSITLNSSDVCNNNDLFAFAKEFSSPAVAGGDHSPIFAEIASSISPSTASSGSPTNHLSRLFNLSPSTLRSYGNMSDFSDSSQSGVISPATSFIENFHKKNGTAASSANSSPSISTMGSTSPAINGSGCGSAVGNNSSIVVPTATTGSSLAASTSTMGRQINTSSSSSSSVKETSSQQVVNSSTTTRVEKKSRLHHITSSSSSSSSSSTSTEMKAAALKRDMSEFKNSMSEINDLALGRSNTPALTGSTGTLSHQPPSINDLSNLNALNSSDAINKLKKKLRSSLENIVDGNSEPHITFPDDHEHDDDHMNLNMDLVKASNQLSTNGLSGSKGTLVDTVKFEEKRTKTESKTKVVADGFSSEQATSNLAESKRLQTGDIDYQQAKAAAASRNRMEVDGVKTEENAAVIHEALSLRAGDVTQQASNNVAAASIKVQSDTFSADKKAISQSQQSQTMTSNGIISQEKHMSSAAQANYSMTSKGVTSSGGSTMISSSSQMSATNGNLFKLADFRLDDLMQLSSTSGQKDIEQAISKYSNMLTSCVNSLQDKKAAAEDTMYLDKINEVIRRAWAVPTHGHELGYSLCNSLRNSGGLDLLMKNCVQGDMQIKFSSAKLLEQCLTTENRTHVVDNGLDKVVNVACVCTKKQNTEHSRVGTGILEHLFKHSEGTCSDVIKLGGLDAVLFECRTSDVETLRHCASALANLSLYGGAENQEAMILRKVPMWLFPLAFHNDDNIKYYACLAIAVLVANKEIEAEVLKSGCLDLVEPFVTSHDPSEFAKSNLAHAHGQSKHWLQRLVPVLSSNREEARSLAAFHFCMEAGIKREQGNTEIFREIGAIEALKTVASCPNAIASKFAAQALRLIGETVPHKLSQQVPLWSVEDVQEWVKQIGFGQFVKQFEESQVDGDLLLKLNEINLRDDIGILNGILLKRFERELQNLKRMADYSSKDTAKLHHFLSEIGAEYCTYTYSMVNAGIDKNSLPQLNEDMLIQECGIKNSIHRLRILNAVKSLENTILSSSEDSMAKTLDVFVSYRRSNGSQLASLLKVHLQLRGFSVFIDVERLEAGKFDNGLLNSIRQAKNFVLVLTPNALERCVEDNECKDWVHREIVAALNSNCNIIPIIDSQFFWPEPERLPEDMRSVCHFNGVTWIHDYQDACIDKLERFMRGEKNIDRIAAMTPGTPGSSVNYQRMHSNDSDYSVGGSNAGSNCGNGGNGGTSNGGGQANHQANRYRQSASPARQRLAAGGGSLLSSSGKLGSTGSQLSVFGRNSKRNMLPPYRTQQTAVNKALPIGGSMQNVSPLAYKPPRRSSAVGICNDNKDKTSSNYRSHSVDELLDNSESTDKKIAEAAALVSAGSLALTNASSTSTLQPNEDYNCSVASITELQSSPVLVPRRDKSANLPPINPQHRKSRSLDHFLDEQTLAAIVVPPSPTEGTQSMQNLAIPMTPEPIRSSIAKAINGLPVRAASVRDSKSLTPDRVTALRNSPSNRQSPEGISSTEDEREDSQSVKSVKSSSAVKTSAPKSQTRAAAHIHRGNSASSNRVSGGEQANRVSKTTSSSSLGSNSGSNSPNNKTIFNRTMKKVRSLIKNNDIEDEELPGLILSKTTAPSPGRMLFW